MTRAEAAQQPEGYVRLRLRVSDGEMSVVGAKAVEGPLVEPRLQGALAYEATVGEKRVAAGGIPDVGQRRSFPDPEGKGVSAGHHVERAQTYEVNVRIPKGAGLGFRAPAARDRALQDEGGAARGSSRHARGRRRSASSSSASCARLGG